MEQTTLLPLDTSNKGKINLECTKKSGTRVRTLSRNHNCVHSENKSQRIFGTNKTFKTKDRQRKRKQNLENRKKRRSRNKTLFLYHQWVRSGNSLFQSQHTNEKKNKTFKTKDRQTKSKDSTQNRKKIRTRVRTLYSYHQWVRSWNSMLQSQHINATNGTFEQNRQQKCKKI